MAKKAFLVGINKHSTSPRFDLRGCVNDVDSLKDLLTGTYGFAGADIEISTDSRATRAAILAGLTKLVSSSSAGDTLVFAASCHGTQKGAAVPEESDGLNEALVPYDVSYENLVVDDELYAIVNPYLESRHVSLLFDCCHSGTMLKPLSFDPCTGGLVEEIDFPVLNRCIPMIYPEGAGRREVLIGPSNVLGACQDNETAADLKSVGPAGLPRGAFSYVLHNILRQKPACTMQEAEALLPDGIRQVSKHPQRPSFVARTKTGRVIAA